MQIKSYKLSATIPTGQYANIQPTIEIETDNLEEAHNVAISHVNSLFETYSEQRLSKNEIIETTKLHSFNENLDVDFDIHRHYYTYKGKSFESASGFTSRFSPSFNAAQVAKQCEKKWRVSSDEIQNLWQSNGNLAASFGIVIHKALEHYINNKIIGETIQTNSTKKENAALPKHPILKKIILDFEKLTTRSGEVLTEIFVTDVKNGLCGQIDRLVIIDRKEKICRIQDYKVNVNCEEESSTDKLLTPFSKLPANKLSKYQIQMSFYALILENSGWIVEGIDAFVLEDEWKHYELENISEQIKQIISK